MMGNFEIRIAIAIVLMAAGLVFLIASTIGMLRLPDFYSRIHASGNSETLGLTLSLLGLMVYEGWTPTAGKLALIFLFIFLGNPIGSHILSKAAFKSGHPVWKLKKGMTNEEGETEDADLHR